MAWLAGWDVFIPYEINAKRREEPLMGMEKQGISLKWCAAGIRLLDVWSEREDTRLLQIIKLNFSWCPYQSSKLEVSRS